MQPREWEEEGRHSASLDWWMVSQIPQPWVMSQ